ncbi:MAG: hypothetical protein R2827_07140 [Bdellovibrionales bacterium]
MVKVKLALEAAEGKPARSVELDDEEAKIMPTLQQHQSLCFMPAMLLRRRKPK